MKALTLIQPWASLIACNYKNIENRTWQPPKHLIGQQIAIHAGRKLDREDLFLVSRELDINLQADELPKSAIVAVATLQKVVTDSENLWFAGPYGWVLKDIYSIDAIPCKGNRGLWDVPKLIQEKIRLQLK